MPNSEENKPYENRVHASEDERRYIVASKLAVNDALNKLFAEIGINRSDAEAMEELREDFRFLRSTRKREGIHHDLDFLGNTRVGMIKAGTRFAMALVTIMAAAFVWGMVQGFKAWIDILITKPPHT